MLISEQFELFEYCHNSNVLIYAPGGGLGHFTRALALSQTLHSSDVSILVSSIPEAVNFHHDAKIQLIPQSVQNGKSKFREWFNDVVVTCIPDVVIIDTFPAGITGELNEVDLSMFYVVLIGRYLKIEVYRRFAGQISNRINKICLVEKVCDHYLHYLKNLCSDISDIVIDDPFDRWEKDPTYINCIKQCTGEKWLLVHSGTQDECEKLYDYAEKIALIHRVHPFYFLCGHFTRSVENPLQIDFTMYPVCQYYSLFDRVITGAGYNSVRQVQKYAHAYNFYPFERLFDDQHARVRHIGKTGITTDSDEVSCANN